MYLIAGLGNPEKKYDNTRHNAGFAAADRISAAFDIPITRISMRGMYGMGLIGGEKVCLLKPVTYMNLSGQAVRAFADYYGIDVSRELIVIYDDTDLPCGKLRIRARGSAGTHNGLKSIVEHLGSSDFARIRIGIGQRPEHMDLADYVLSQFDKNERQVIDDSLRDIPDIVGVIIKEGIEAAQTRYNTKKTEP